MLTWLEEMSAHTTITQAMKQSVRSTDSDSATANESSDSEPSKKHAISTKTIEKWIRENEHMAWVQQGKRWNATVIEMQTMY